MTPGERVLNVLAGASVLSWSALGLRRMWLVEGPSVVRAAVILLNLCVGVLFLVRAPVRIDGGFRRAAVVGVSFLAAGAAFALAPVPSAWPTPASVAFACGAALAAGSLVCLGRSFAVLPAVRAVVTRGPYRLIRHPAYAGELAMVAACCLAGGGWWSACLVPACLATVLLRIRLEESLLRQDPRYHTYAQRVRYRLVPGLW